MPVSNTSKVYKGLGSQTIITVVSGILSFANFAIMSRLLSRETFGLFAIITAVMVVVNEVNSAGMGSAVIQRKNVEKGFFSTSFSLSIITGFFFTVLVFVLSPCLSNFFVQSNRLDVPFKIVSITLLLNNICSVLKARYMRNLQFLKFGTYQIIVTVLSYGIGITLALRGYQLAAIVLASVSNSFFMAILLLWLNRTIICFKIEKRFIQDIISYAGWLTASGIVRSIYEQIDKLLTTRWLSVAALGAYNRPNGFVFQISSTINGIFDTTLFPILSNIQDDKTKIHSAYEKSVELTWIFSIIMAYAMILGAHLLTLIFLGREWLDLVPIFQIASITIIFLFYGRIGDSFFRSTGYVKDYFYLRVAVCSVSIFCVYIGCKYDIIGLAIGVLVSRIFDVIVKMIVLGKRLKINQLHIIKKIGKDMLLPTLCFAICYALTLLKKFEFMLVLSLFAFIVFLTLILLYRPQSLGSVFYENVFFPFKGRIKNYINK